MNHTGRRFAAAVAVGISAWAGCSSDRAGNGADTPADALAAFEARAATIALDLAQDVAPQLVESIGSGVPQSAEPFARFAGRVSETAAKLCGRLHSLAGEAGSERSKLLAEARASAADEVRDSVVTVLLRQVLQQPDEGRRVLDALGVRATAPNGEVIDGAPALTFVGLFDREFTVVVPAPGTAEYRQYEEWGTAQGAGLFRTVELAVGKATAGLDKCES